VSEGPEAGGGAVTETGRAVIVPALEKLQGPSLLHWAGLAALKGGPGRRCPGEHARHGERLAIRAHREAIDGVQGLVP
jgi:hypothetical protein